MNPAKIGFLILPSPHERAWRSAVTEAAVAAGFSVAKSATWLKSNGNAVGQLLIAGSAAEARDFGDAHWVVVTTELTTAVNTMSARVPHALSKGYRLLAELLAAQAWLIDKGVVLSHSDEKSLDLPYLGAITRECAPDESPPVADASPLSLYCDAAPSVGASAEWPHDLFVFKNAAKAILSPPHIDLTGRGRVLVYGPRFALPPGRWQATANFTVDTEGSDLFLKFQWGVGEDFHEMQVTLQNSGAYEVTLDHAWNFVGSAELRVWAANAHFLGRMEFHGAKVVRLPDLEGELRCAS
jgi:hypothetical protein